MTSSLVAGSGGGPGSSTAGCSLLGSAGSSASEHGRSPDPGARLRPLLLPRWRGRGAPDQAFAIADPAEPGRAAVFRCHVSSGGETGLYQADGSRYQRGGWLVWGRALEPHLRALGQPRGLAPLAHVDGLPPRPRVGDERGAYPWTWRGQAFQPCVCQQWDSRTRELLPCSMSTAQGVLDLMLQRIWIMYCFHVVSTPRTFALSAPTPRRLRADDERARGLDQHLGPRRPLPGDRPSRDGRRCRDGGCTSALWRSSRAASTQALRSRRRKPRRHRSSPPAARASRLRRRRQSRRAGSASDRQGEALDPQLPPALRAAKGHGGAQRLHPEGRWPSATLTPSPDATEGPRRRPTPSRPWSAGLSSRSACTSCAWATSRPSRGVLREAATQYIEEAGAVAARRVQLGDRAASAGPLHHHHEDT